MKIFFAASLLICALLTGVAKADQERLIVVNGVAEKSLDPNMLSLNIEVWSKAGTAKQAQQLAANQFKIVKKTFDDFKLKREDMQTENYSLNPEYEYDQKLRQNKMTGFRVSQVLVVTLRKVDEAGTFLDSLVTEKKAMDSGVNLNSINWDSDKRTQAEIATLADAVRSARAKAEEIAKAAGVKVTAVSKISHSTHGGGQTPIFRNYALKAEQSAQASTEVAPGQVKVRVEVSAEYEIK